MPELSSSLPPLNIGNVVNAALILYRSHLKPYLRLGLTTILWCFWPVLALVPFGMAIYAAVNGQSVPPFIWVLVPLWIAFFVYCIAQYLLNSAVLTRVAFRELVNQPEAIADVRKQLRPKLWKFFGLAALVGVLIGAVYGALAMAGGIAMFAIIAALSLIAGPVIGPLVGGLFFVVLVFGGLSWFYARLISAEVVLAVEENADIGQSLGRSWTLSETSAIRVQGVILVAFLVTLPLLLVTNYLPSLFLLRLEPNSPEYWLVYGVSMIASFAVWIIQLPFWQAVKAVLYYDLRNRREGFGLQLRDRET
ncbi:MAG TPA: hypothetical protein V6C78_24340 [Crinalium sp.]|jgi:hypothetical protein